MNEIFQWLAIAVLASLVIYVVARADRSGPPPWPPGHQRGKHGQ